MAHVRLMSTAYGAPWTGIQGTGVTATGIDLRAHPKQYVVAVDPSVIPLGSKLKIPENPFGDPNIVFTAADTGGAIKGKRLDFYDWRGRKAQMNWGTRSIVAQIVGKGNPKSAMPAGGSQRAAGAPSATFSPGQSSSDLTQQPSGADIATLVQQLMQPQKAIGAGGYLQDPSFTARAKIAMPQGYQPIQSSGGPAPRVNPADVINQLLPSLAGAPMPADAQPKTNVTPGSPASGGGGSGRAGGGASGGVRLGRLIGKPIDRPGVSTSPQILRFAQQVAGVLNSPLQVGTGTAHNEFVQGTSRQSAHWIGKALDLPAVGARLTHMGHAALIAAGMPADQARAQKGGLFNVGRYQIIFNSNEGGNHYNHLHVGLRG